MTTRDAQPIAVLTRPAERNTAIASELIKCNWRVLEAPALRIEPIALDGRVPPDPDCFDLVVFVSRSAVLAYRNQLPAHFVWPARCVVATVGQSTANAVQDAFGTDTQVIYPKGDLADSESLWMLLQPHMASISRVLVVRGVAGREWLIDQMQQLGLKVVSHAVYLSQANCLDQSTASALKHCAQGEVKVVWLFTSLRSLDSVVEQIEQLKLVDWFVQCEFVLTHSRFLPALQKFAQKSQRKPIELGVKISKPDDKSIVTCILNRFETPKITIGP